MKNEASFNILNEKMMNKSNEISRFQYITVDHPRLSHSDQVYRAYHAGCRWVQIRIKNKPEAEVIKEVEKAINAAHEFKRTLIINDFVNIAASSRATGVHLGKNDMNPINARKILGSNFIIGATANTFQDILKLSSMPIEYIGLGPYRFTTTKQNLSPIIGLEGYINIIKQVNQAKITIPIIAIGGIQFSDLEPLVETGIYGVAVSTAIACSNDFEENMYKFVEFFEKLALTEKIEIR